MHTHIKKIYMSKKERKKLLFKCILKCVDEHGLFNTTIYKISMCAKCSISLVKLHYGGIISIRRMVLEYAKINNIEKILNTPITDIVK